MNNEDLAYLAGMIDGEGHFYKPKNTNGRGDVHYYPVMLFVQSEQNNGLELCEWAKQRFGGNISKTRDLYRWQLSGKKAVELTMMIKPYLIVKKEQIKRIIEDHSAVDICVVDDAHNLPKN
jgi:hypothetical protein